jgi:hypothetical protein
MLAWRLETNVDCTHKRFTADRKRPRSLFPSVSLQANVDVTAVHLGALREPAVKGGVGESVCPSIHGGPCMVVHNLF